MTEVLSGANTPGHPHKDLGKPLASRRMGGKPVGVCGECFYHGLRMVGVCRLLRQAKFLGFPAPDPVELPPPVQSRGRAMLGMARPSITAVSLG